MAIKTTPVQDIFSIDLRSLALYRILLGAILLLDVINRMTLVPAFYSDNGIVPRGLVNLENIEHAYHFQLMMLSGSEWFSYIFLGILGLLGLLLVVGYKTRVVTVLAWLFFCAANVRGELILHAGDTLLTLLLFWGMFLPLGKVYSADALKEEYQSKNHRYFSLVTIGMYIQFVLIYIMNGLYKGQYLAWVDGSHLYNTFSRFEFIKPFALLIYPYYDFLSFLTQFSLWLELFGPLLFFIPVWFVFFRMTGIVLFLGLQLSILLTLNIGLFPVISITGILVFLPTEFWNGIERKVQTRPSRVVGNKNFEATGDLTPNTISTLFIAVVIVYITVWNIAGYSSKIDLPDAFKMPGYYLNIDQKWALFSGPAIKSKYLSVVATYQDDSVQDLTDDLKSYSKAIGDMRYARYDNYRWRIFFTKRVGVTEYNHVMPQFIDYLIDTYGEGKELERVDIIPHQHFIEENYNLTPLQTDILYTLTYEN